MSDELVQIEKKLLEVLKLQEKLSKMASNAGKQLDVNKPPTDIQIQVMQKRLIKLSEQVDKLGETIREKYDEAVIDRQNAELKKAFEPVQAFERSMSELRDEHEKKVREKEAKRIEKELEKFRKQLEEQSALTIGDSLVKHDIAQHRKFEELKQKALEKEKRIRK